MPPTTGSFWTIAEPAPETAAAIRDARADRRYLLGFVVANLALKLALVPLNRGEYTDGILQLLVFDLQAKLYPPLFGVLARLVSFGGLELETAGRVVSAVAGALAVVPVYWMAMRLRGATAARFAALFFTLSPMVLRWSGHAMTDSLFFALGATTMALCAEAWARVRDGSPRKRTDLWLAAAVVSGAFAALTRYQGAFLAVVLAVPLLAFVRRHRALPPVAVLAGVVWLALPAWIVHHGFVHGQQFSARSSSQWISTFLDYLNLAESFVYIAPYYFGLPVVALGLAGLFKCDRRAPYTRVFLMLWALWGIVVVILQSMFQSFQYRYMMPVLPGGACTGWGGMRGHRGLASVARQAPGVLRAVRRVHGIHGALLLRRAGVPARDLRRPARGRTLHSQQHARRRRVFE